MTDRSDARGQTAFGWEGGEARWLLSRHRIALTGLCSAIKNRVHTIVANHGITRGHADLFGKGGRQCIEKLQLREAPRRRLDSLMSRIAGFDRETTVSGRNR